MQLNEYTANKIVERSYSIVGLPINVMNHEGVIIASSDVSRVHTFHDGALEVLMTGKVVKLSSDTALLRKGAKEGINIPIYFKRDIIGVIGVNGPLDVVEELAHLVSMATELILENLDLMSKIHTVSKHKEDLLELLIQEKHADKEYVSNIADFVKYDLSPAKVVGILKINSSDPISTALFQELVEEIYLYEKSLLVSTLSVFQREIVILKNDDKDKHTWLKELVRYLENHKGLSIRGAFGSVFPGLNGIALSYQTARLALDNRIDSRKKVVMYDDNVFKYQFCTLEDKEWVRHQLRLPLTQLENVDSNLVLILTMKTYLSQNCDQPKTCKQLGIHRNTLRYRLAKIESVISLDFNRLDDLFKIYTAITYYS
ncbi:CdaR family transcriptional regulator [Vibrio nitrifigilis]|uniref:Helix-turn-helix domain-containing protein n=1 Tax=Vibrio nitrifigilis TaxID=2789781 RepID=A0ABS0GE07_9VIBR|nr:sugar diacid recognition domain-containing protein [Vibrio nitrifigilis]MBF9000636.1 helix-turn-helix domain-containing protein [Vibrio nitrifigilis]